MLSMKFLCSPVHFDNVKNSLTFMMEKDVNVSLQVTTHQELDEVSMLSFAGNLTPFSDFNQSPRNMYKCQVRFQNCESYSSMCSLFCIFHLKNCFVNTFGFCSIVFTASDSQVSLSINAKLNDKL